MGWRCAACGGENPDGMRFCGHCGTARAADPGAVDGSQGDAGAVTGGRAEVADRDATDALKSFVSSQVADRLVASGGAITEERRLVTCLFADISGFTPLADKLDPEELLDVIDPIINALTEIVGRYEGYVDKFAGDALLAFFGAPVAHEDDADRAVLVALEMHDKLQAMLPQMPEPARDLTLHIGINTGHVVARVLGTDVRMDYSVLGDAVILAQRLESAAPAGRTYVGENTYLLTRSRFTFEDAGTLTLKGKSEPVQAWILTGHAERQSSGPRLFGREDEQRALDRVAQNLGAGRGGVIGLCGDAGIGKTALLAHLRDAAQQEDIRILSARCLSYGSAITYWPFAELLRRQAGVTPASGNDEALQALHRLTTAIGVEEQRPYLARMLGLPAPELDQQAPEDIRVGLRSALRATLVAIASSRPTLLIVEDTHWIDPSSYELLNDAAELAHDHPLGLAVSARPEGKSALRDVIGVAHGHLLELEALRGPALEAAVTDVLGAPLASTAANMVVERAAGNPFFAREMVRSLVDRSMIERCEDGWRLADDAALGELPLTIESALSSRIDVLPPAHVQVLQGSGRDRTSRPARAARCRPR